MKTIVRLILLLVILIGVNYLYINFYKQNSFSVEKFIEQQINNTLEPAGLSMTIEGSTNLLSSTPKIEKITINNHKGSLLEADNIDINLNLWALLRGTVEIKQLNIDSLSFINKPSAMEIGLLIKQFTHKSSWLKKLLTPNIALNKFNIRSLHMPYGKNNKQTNFPAEGLLYLSSKSSKLQFSLSNQNKAEEYAKFSWQADKSKNYVSINGKLISPANGALKELILAKYPGNLDINLNSDGALDDLTIKFNLRSNQDDLLSGQLQQKLLADKNAYNINIIGKRISQRPDILYGIWGSNFNIKGQAIATDKYFTIEQFSVTSPMLLASLQANMSDGKVENIALSIDGTKLEDKAFTLTSGNQPMSLDKVHIKLDYNKDYQPSIGKIFISNLHNQNNQFATIDLNLAQKEVIENQEKQRKIIAKGNLQIEASSSFLKYNNYDVDVQIAPQTSGSIHLDKFNIKNKDFALDLQGIFEASTLLGNLNVVGSDLQVVSFFANQPVKGKLNLKAKGYINFNQDAIHLDVSGEKIKLETNSNKLNRLLNQETTIAGIITYYKKHSFQAENFKISNANNYLYANGIITEKFADFNFKAELADSKILLSNLSGAGSLALAINRPNANLPPHIVANYKIAKGQLNNAPLENITLKLIGDIYNNPKNSGLELRADANLEGLINKEKTNISTGFIIDNRLFPLAVKNLKAQIGTSSILADLTSDGTPYFIKGRAEISSNDISTIAKLTPNSGSGSLNAKLLFANENGAQSITVDAKGNQLNYGPYNLAAGRLSFVMANIYKLPLIDGSGEIHNLDTPKLKLADAYFNAENKLNSSQFSISAAVNKQEFFVTSGVFSRLSKAEWKLNINKLQSTINQLPLYLAGPTNISLTQNQITIDHLKLDILGGNIFADGYFGKNMGMEVKVQSLPLAITNYIYPKLGLQGVLNGQLKLQGNQNQPIVDFDIKADKIDSNLNKEYNLAAINIKASGNTNNAALHLYGKAESQSRQLEVKGTITNDTEIANLVANFKDIPLDLLNSFIVDQKISGNLSGSAGIVGKLKSPNLSFDISANKVQSTLFSSHSIDAANIQATGELKRNKLSLQHFEIDNTKGLALTANGSAILQSQPILDVTVNGDLPLETLNFLWKAKGTQLHGQLKIASKVSGMLLEPSLDGTVSITNGSFFTPKLNIYLKNVVANGILKDNDLIIENFKANGERGAGFVTGTGTITINANQHLPAHLQLQFNNAYYSNGRYFQTNFSGPITVTGGLLKDPYFTGNLKLNQTMLTLADFSNKQVVLPVKHIGANQSTIDTLYRAGIYTHNVKSVYKSHIIASFNVEINAPEKIYISGRGINAELGGTVNIGGDSTHLDPTGSFNLIKGRYDIFGRSLALKEGQVSLIGSFTPQLHFTSQIESNNYVINLEVDGQPTAMQVTFNSNPSLPQDEIMARILFDTSLHSLSPLQLLQVTSELVNLSQQNQESLLQKLRDKTGLDNLNVIQDADGNTGVSLGWYLLNRVYLGLETTLGGTNLIFDLNINKSLKARSSFTTRGFSNVGLFYERNY